MSIDIYSTYTLAGVISNTKPSVPGFWLNFATRQFNFATEEIHFDVVQTDNRRVAPYQGRQQPRSPADRGRQAAA